MPRSPWPPPLAGLPLGGPGQAAPVVLDLDVEPLRARSGPARCARVARAWRSALVRPSWAIRYAARSTPGLNGTGSPSTRRSTCMSPDATWRTSRSSSDETGLRCQRERLLALGAQHAEEAAHLGQGLAGGRLDGGEVGRLRGVLGTEAAAHGLGLDGHHADRVGHDVVQLAGDPGAFLGGRLRGLELAVALELLGARDAPPRCSRCGFRVMTPTAQGPAKNTRPAARSLGSKPSMMLTTMNGTNTMAEPEVVQRRVVLGADGEGDQHQREQRGELALRVGR